MKRIIFTAFAFIALFGAQISDAAVAQNKTQNQKANLVEYVNPFVGTDFHGHTFPGATYPFGMVQLSPDTRLTGWDGCSGYHYSDKFIYGFSHTHLSGTGVPDYCDILLMPVSGFGGEKLINEEYKSAFSHKNEKASPGYYEVMLDTWRVKARLTSGRRMGFHEYTYAGGAKPQIVLDLLHRDPVLDSRIEMVGDRAVKGYRRSKSWAKDQIVYFYIEFSQPVKSARLFLDEAPVTGAGAAAVKTIKGKNCKALFEFEAGSANVVMAKVGISSVSEENAMKNMTAESADWDFNKILKGTEGAWNEFLGRIEVTGKDQEALKTFYTALYHTGIAPNLYSDYNGEYRGMDREVYTAEGYEQYTVFSLWDTYRTLHPLLTIIDQKRTTDFIRSFLAIYEQADKLPIWELAGNETNCMIGYHSVSVMADAIRKGIGGFEKYDALDAMLESSVKKEYGINIFGRQGFVPAELEHESVSKTLEYAYDDWCIAQTARLLGRDDIYKRYIRRAQYYKNLFDPSTGFMRPRLNGKWLSPFSPSEVNVHFTEANSWQYSFYVPQDIETHIKLLGGDAAYIRKLDELFTAPAQTTGRTQVDITGLIGQYAHGNEPSHHVAYLYNYAGAPWKTQEMVRKIMKSLYTSAPDGLSGNDDCGQMSAWYVMSALGFYPVCPGDNTYALGSPLFEKSVIKLENGKSFTITAKGAGKSFDSGKEIYVQSASLNGAAYGKSFLMHSDIMSGSNFEVKMGSKPSVTFGAAHAERPSSFIGDMPVTVSPWFEYDNNIFRDSLVVRLNAFSGEDKVFFRIEHLDDEDESDEEFTEYASSIVLKENAKIHEYSVSAGGIKSFTVEASFKKINQGWNIDILSKYNPQYNAGGNEGLIDGVRGSKNFRLGGWQGYQNTDFTAVIDMGSVKSLQRVGAGFLQDARSWIWMPKYVEFYISEDGKEFSLIGKVDNSVGDQDMDVQIKDLVLGNISAKGRFIKVFAKNYGAIPQWHEGFGGQAFIFVDEIFAE
jgi:predicted alpha-1,2-mannosidase